MKRRILRTVIAAAALATVVASAPARASEVSRPAQRPSCGDVCLASAVALAIFTPIPWDLIASYLDGCIYGCEH